MPIDIAELRVIVDADNSPMRQKLDEAGREINDFGAREFNDAKIDLNTQTALEKIAEVRRQWSTMRSEMAVPLAPGVLPTTAPVVPGGGALPPIIPVNPAGGAQSVNQQAATNAQLERAAQVSAQRQANIRAEGAARGEAKVESIELSGAAKRESIELEAQTRLTARVDSMRTQAAERQALREQQIASRRAAMTTSQSWATSARGLRAGGMNTLMTGALMTATITAPLVAAGTKIGRASIEWESAFTEVRRTVSGTREELDGLAHQLRQMAAGPNPIPVKATDLAAIAETAGQLGIHTPAIAGFTKTIAALTVATRMTKDEASSDLAKLANITQMPQENFDRLGSTIARLKNVGASTVQEMLALAMRIAGTGHNLGMTQPQILGVANALTSLGIEAESGGSAFNRALINISKASSQNSKELLTFAHVAGMSVGEFKKLFDKDATEAVTRFVEGLGQLKKGQIFQVLDTLGLKSIRLSDTLSRAAGAGKLMRESLEEGGKAWEQNTALADATGKVYGTTANQMVVFSNRMNELALSIGDRVMPALNGVIKVASDSIPGALGTMIDQFSKLPGPVKAFLIGLVAAVALAGPVAVLAGNVQLLAGAAVTLGAAALANPVAALIALAAVAGTYVVLSGALNDIADATARLKQNDAGLDAHFAAMGEALSSIKLPENAQLAGKIQKLRLEIAGAGNDMGKLHHAMDDLNAVRNEIKFKVKDPDLKIVMNAELDATQRLLNERQLSVNVLVKPILQSVEEKVTQSLGITKAGRPLWDVADAGGQGDFTNHLIDWLSGTGWNGDAADGGDPSGKHGLYKNNAQLEVTAALDRGHAATMKAKAAARQGAARQAFDALHPLGGPADPMLGFGGMPRVKSPLPDIGDFHPSADGPKTYSAPGVKPLSAKEEADPVGAARARLTAKKAKADKAAKSKTVKPALSASDLEKQNKVKTDAEKAQEKAAREANRLEERARSQAATSLDKQGRAWSGFAEQLNESQTKMLEFGDSTEAARVKAKMMREEFDGIPQSLKTAAVEVARLVEDAEKLTKARDGVRGGNNAAFGKLLTGGADTGAFLAAVKAQEAVYKFGSRIGSDRSQAATIGGFLASQARQNARALAGRADSLRDYNAENGADLGQTFDSSATSAQGARIARVVAQRHISGFSASFKHQCEALAETTYWAAGVHDYDRILAAKGSAKQTMERFKAANIGMRYTPGMKMAPGGLLYSGSLGEGYGHVQEIGPDGARYDQYELNKVKESNFQWYVPPPGALNHRSSTPASNAPGEGMAHLNAVQQSTAQSIIAVGRQMGASNKVITSALATALMESTMGVNVHNGHALGAFQQMPSWGSEASRLNVAESAKRFTARAMAADAKNPSLSVNDLAQKVQASDKPSGYAKFEEQARAILGAGGTPAASRPPAPSTDVALGTRASGGRVIAPPAKWIAEQNRLLTLSQSMLKGWGKFVNDSDVKPGESRSFRLESQNKLFERLQNKEKISPQEMAADRAVANAADFAQSHADATQGAAKASKDFARAEHEKLQVLHAGRRALDASGGSMAAYERAVFLAQKRIEIYTSKEVLALWNQKRFHEANALASKTMSGATQGFNEAQGDESAKRVAGQTRAQHQELDLLNKGRALLSRSAGLPEAAIAREMELLNGRQAEYNRLIDEGKSKNVAAKLAKEWSERERINASMRDRIALEEQFAAQKRQTQDEMAGLREEGELITGSSLNAGERARKLVGDNARRAKSREVDAAVALGSMTRDEANDAVRGAGITAQSRYDQESGNRRAGQDRILGEEHAGDMASLRRKSRLTERLDSSKPELGIQLQLEEKHAQLLAQNAQLAASEKFSLKARLKLYEEQIRAESALSRLAQSRQNASHAEDATDALRMQREEFFVKTAAERLAIEQKNQNAKNRDDGIKVSGKELGEQAKQRDIQSDIERMGRVKAMAEMMRDHIAGALKEGMDKGVGAMLASYFKGMADMMKAAAITRVANRAVKGVFGVDLSDPNSPDIFDVLNRKDKKRDKAGDAAPTEGTASDLPSIVSGLKKHREGKREGMPGWMQAAGALLGGGGFRHAASGSGGGAAGTDGAQKMENATFVIQNANMTAQTATINTRGGAAGSGTSGAGSSPSGDQIASGLHTLLRI